MSGDLPLDDDARPRLPAAARLRWDRVRGGVVLLLPERGFRLTGSGAAIVALCTGTRTVRDIVDEVQPALGLPPFAADAAGPANEVRAFLAALVARGGLDLGGEG